MRNGILRILLIKGVALTLALFYLYSTVPSLYHLFSNNHDHTEKITHNHDAHVDGCHNYVYHGAPATSCKHESHILPISSDCLACHFVKTLKITTTGPISIEQICFNFEVNSWTHDYKIVQEIIQSKYLRGPPNIV